jgi:hypothetical protein
MSIMIDGDQAPPARAALRVATFRYFEEEGYEPLPYVRCMAVHYREGPTASWAEFDYISQNADPSFDPITFESVLPLIDRGGGDVVRTDSRIVVACMTPDGEYRYMFDGFCTNPGTRFSAQAHGSRYEVAFQAVGVEKRCWDRPLLDCWQRHTTAPDDAEKNIKTQIPIRFNPKGLPNRTPAGSDMTPPGDLPQRTPIFLDPSYKGKDDKDKKYQQLWTLSDFCKYILSIGNPDEDHVTNPDFDVMSAVLDVYTPKKDAKGRPGKYYDYRKPETYDKNPIVIADVDATGRKWPDVLAQVLDANGYSMCFRLAIDDSGETPQPYTYLDIYKKFDSKETKYKDLFLDQWGRVYDPAMNNVQSSDVQHDTARIVNRVSLQTAPELVEVSMILAPLFKVDPADKDNTANFVTGSATPDDDPRAYREFGIDETAEGHWNVKNWIWSDTILDLEPIFPADKKDPKTPDEEDDPEKRRRYVDRQRPSRTNLISEGEDGKPYEPTLHISFNYNGNTPAIWDGSDGDWVEIPGGHGWRLLRDRFGIRIIAKDPNAWPIGDMKGNIDLTADKAGQLSTGQIRAVEWLSTKRVATDSQAGNFHLMLTGVIEADRMAEVVADKRPASPTEFTIEQSIDAKSEYQPKRLYRHSWYEVERGTSSDEDFTIFDKDKAQAYVDGRREAGQLGKFSLRVEIPRLTAAYTIGDRIRQISGRDCDFTMNLSGGIETASYPKVIGFTWHCGQGERTSLILSETAIVRRRR